MNYSAVSDVMPNIISLTILLKQILLLLNSVHIGNLPAKDKAIIIEAIGIQTQLHSTYHRQLLNNVSLLRAHEKRTNQYEKFHILMEVLRIYFLIKIHVLHFKNIYKKH